MGQYNQLQSNTVKRQKSGINKYGDLNVEMRRLSKSAYWEGKRVQGGRYLNIFGFLHNNVAERNDATIMIVDFGASLDEADEAKNRLLKSDQGYFQYLPCQKGLCGWEVEIFVPENINFIKIGFKALKNRGSIVLHTPIEIRESISAVYLQNLLDKQQAELVVAQQKRSGHYEKLVYEQKRVKKLQKQIELLEKENQRMKNSLSLAVGNAIVNTKSVKAAFQLPGKIVAAFKNHKHKLNAKNKPKQNIVKTSIPDPEKHANNHKVSQPKNDDAIGILGWPPLQDSPKIRMMSIFDEFSRECFVPLANLIEPRPDNCIPLLHRDKPKLLFVESTWRGNKSTWQYRVAKYAHPPGQELFDLLAECKKEKIPTVFWNKEDPVHFDNFIHSAKEFDYIFTTAEEAIPKYREKCKAKVHALPFAAEAGLHNPIGSAERNEKICFAGSYYANRFVERRDDQLMLLNAAIAFDLEIFDRNAGADVSKDFQFPERFTPFIRGKLPYQEMNKAYRNYKVFLNVNSVIDSKTMFSRRVFELLACGTPVVSTVSAGIEEMFGNGLVWMVKNEAEAQEALHTLLTSPQEWRRRSLQGIRSVFASHTFAHRFEEVLRITGIAEHYVVRKKVLCLAEAHTQEELDRLGEICRHQELAGVSKTLLVFAKNKKLVSRYADTTIVEGGEMWSSDVIKREAKQFEATHIAFFDPKTIYGAFYLQDMLYAFDYSGARIIGKPNILKDIYDYDQAIAPNSVIADISLLDTWTSETFKEQNVLEDARKKGIRVFAPDSANFYAMTEWLPSTQYKDYLRKIEI